MEIVHHHHHKTTSHIKGTTEAVNQHEREYYVPGDLFLR